MLSFIGPKHDIHNQKDYYGEIILGNSPNCLGSRPNMSKAMWLAFQKFLTFLEHSNLRGLNSSATRGPRNVFALVNYYLKLFKTLFNSSIVYGFQSSMFIA